MAREWHGDFEVPLIFEDYLDEQLYWDWKLKRRHKAATLRVWEKKGTRFGGFF